MIWFGDAARIAVFWAIPDVPWGQIVGTQRLGVVAADDLNYLSARHGKSPHPHFAEIWIAAAAEDDFFAGLSSRLADDVSYVGLSAPGHDQHRRLATRGLLRHALSASTEFRFAPAEWRFGVDSQGKPFVCGGLPPLHFSVTHCALGSAVAVSSSLSVGIDIERLDQQIEPGLITHFTSPNERAALALQEEAARGEAFLTLWTLKEAYAKSIGAGLDLEFADLEFDLESRRSRDDAAFYTREVHLGGCAARVSLAISHPRSLATGSGERAHAPHYGEAA